VFKFHLYINAYFIIKHISNQVSNS